MVNGNKLRTYRNLKSSYELEKYLLTSDNHRLEVSTFVKIQISAHTLFIEEGRYTKTPLEQRICRLCKSSVEDEIHFVVKCCKLDIIRQEFYAKMTSIYPDFHSMNNVDKFTFIMNSHDYDINKMCITFISRMYELRQVILKV